MSLGRVIKPRVFLEGVEIPVYSVVVQTTIGAPSVAAISIPPSEKFFERYDEDPVGSGNFTKKTGVIPRSMVHVFYEDSSDTEKQPRLLFEGEFVRFEYSKQTSARALTMYAKDTSNLLSSIYVRYYTDFFTPYGNLVSAFAGVGTTDKPDAENIRMNILNQTSLNPEIASALSDDKNGIGVGASFKSIVDKALRTNTFFANFNSRAKIVTKIASLVDRKSRKLLEASLFESMVKQNMANLKESATAWDLYMTLMSLVFYYPVSISAPPYITNEIVDTPTSGDTLKVPYSVLPAKTTMNLLLKPYTWWTAPPTFNVIFPCQYKTFSLSRDFLSEPTRIVISAFGVIESTAQQELVRAAPSQFMFIAPEALAKKFNHEVFDSKAKKLGSAQISTVSSEIEDLQGQKRAAEAKTFDATLSLQEKNAAKAKVTDLDQQIAEKNAELASLIKQADSQTSVKPLTENVTPVDMDAQYWNRSVLTASDGVTLASREDHKGIVFGFDYLTQTQVEVTKAKAISPTSLKNYLSNIANYKLVIQQHRARATAMSLHFAPHIVAGFPALVVDPNRNFFGEVESVTHSFDANGAADTSVQLSFVRGDDMEFSESRRSDPNAILFPQWINEKYLPGNVGESVYKTLFPKNGNIGAADSIMAFGPNQREAAREIRRRYFRSQDDLRFALSFTRRNVASLDQTFSVLGAQKVNPGHYVMDTSSSERRVAVLEYAAEVSKVAVVAKSEVPSDGFDRVANPIAVAQPAPVQKSASERVSEVTADQEKEIEVRSAAKSLKLEIVTRFNPPAAIPPSGPVKFTRSSDGKVLTARYEDSENILVDVVTITSESGASIKYSARGEYTVKLPEGVTALLAAATVAATFEPSSGVPTRDDAFLSGLRNVDAAVLAKLKEARL